MSHPYLIREVHLGEFSHDVGNKSTLAKRTVRREGKRKGREREVQESEAKGKEEMRREEKQKNEKEIVAFVTYDFHFLIWFKQFRSSSAA